MATKVTTGLISADAALVDLNIDANTLYVDASANRVGIGKTDPASAFHVKGDEVQIEDPSGGYKLHLNADANPVVITANDNTGANYCGFRLKTNNGGAYPVTVMDVYPSGGAYVGFGAGARTDTQMLISRAPSSDSQTTPETVLVLSNPCTTTASDIKVGQGPRLLFEIPDDQTGNKATGAAIAALKEIDSDTNSQTSLAFYTSGDDETLDQNMTILSDGKVGIGTTSPSQKLDVNGYIKATRIGAGISPIVPCEVLSTGSTSTALRVLKSGSDDSTQNNLFSVTEISGHGRLSIHDTSQNEDIRFDSNGISHLNGGKVVIGDTASHVDDLLQIETPASGGGHGIQIRRNDSNTDQGIGRVMFGNNTDTDLATVSAKTDGATDSGALLFSTQATGGSSTERMRISGDNVFIKTTNTSQSAGSGVKFINTRLYMVNALTSGEQISYYGNGGYKYYVSVAGKIHTAVGPAVYSVSDERLKENIRDYDKGLADILKLKPRLFDWKEGEGSNEKNVSGFVAQECEEAGFDEFVGDFKHDTLTDAKSFGAGGLITATIKAIQELKEENDSLKARIETLEG